MDSRTKALCDFLNAAHSVYHAQAYLAETLKNAGYTRLYEQDEWAPAPGGKYFLTRGGSALVAFRVPQGSPKGFLMSASHSDRPTFKVKENFELAAAYTRIAVERYGGMLISPWLDRPLSVAGRVTVETEAGVETKLLDIDRDLLLIPNVAIHMNRQAERRLQMEPGSGYPAPHRRRRRSGQAPGAAGEGSGRKDSGTRPVSLHPAEGVGLGR